MKRRRLGSALTLAVAALVLGAPATVAAPGPTPSPSQTLPNPIPMATLPGPPPQLQPGQSPNNAGMGIDGMVPPPPIQHGNQPFLYERYPALDYTPLHMDAGTVAQSVVCVLGDPATLALNVSLNGAASLGMGLLVLIGTLTTRLLAWSLRVDLLASADGPLNAVVGGLARDLYQPFIPPL